MGRGLGRDRPGRPPPSTRRDARAGCAPPPSAPAAVGVNYVVKLAVRRRRPRLRRLPPLASAPSELSFPSAHATSSLAAATAMGRVAPGARPPLYGLAAAICLTRPYLGMHYPSDVLGGAAIGLLIGRLWPGLRGKGAEDRLIDLAASAAPSAAASGDGPGADGRPSAPASRAIGQPARGGRRARALVKVGIVGLPNAGKTTLFNALTRAGAETAAYPFTTVEPNVAIVEVPDERLAAVAQAAGASPQVRETIEFHDIAGLVRGASAGEGLGNRFLAEIRETDAICHVVRAHGDERVPHPDGRVDPLADAEVVEAELLLADLEQARAASGAGPQGGRIRGEGGRGRTRLAAAGGRGAAAVGSRRAACRPRPWRRTRRRTFRR